MERDIKFDTKSFENTAKAVFEMNDSSAERYIGWKHLMGFMENMAYQYSIDREETLFSTGGFCLTAFNVNGYKLKERHVVATVTAFTAIKYLEAA